LDLEEKTQKIDSAYVKNRLKDVLQREDLARFIL
jgi:ATP-dependent protease HslVU (ClpYQ) ATPase subunit